MYSIKFYLTFGLVIYLINVVISKNIDNVHYCLDGKHHKSTPGPESELFSECTPWKNKSCCTQNTTKNVRELNLYYFNYNHCGPMTEKCTKHFKRDLCFYECSPNIGPWVVSVNMKIRQERYYAVPLCQSECDTWFEDCKEDKTCAKIWVNGFKWNNGTNECLPDADCKTFKEMYGDAKTFCELVWDHSWEYTADDKPCMKMWFDGKKGNPNDVVTTLKIEESFKSQQSKSGASTHVKMEYLMLFYIVYAFLHNLYSQLKLIVT